MADDSSLNIRYREAKGTWVSGSTDPNSVPYTIKYHMFINNYGALFGPALVQEISPTDHAILTYASTTLDAFHVSNQNTTDRELVDLCTRRGSMPAKDVARQVTRIYANSEARLERHLRHIVSRLSDSGRSKVVDYVNNNVASGINTFIPQTGVEISEENPAEFEYWMENECHRILTGEYPPELRERMEQVRRQIFGNDTGEIERFGNAR